MALHMADAAYRLSVVFATVGVHEIQVTLKLSLAPIAAKR